ncbi:MAG: hypothetical protein ABH811_00480 [archaeon]
MRIKNQELELVNTATFFNSTSANIRVDVLDDYGTVDARENEAYKLREAVKNSS